MLHVLRCSPAAPKPANVLCLAGSRNSTSLLMIAVSCKRCPLSCKVSVPIYKKALDLAKCRMKTVHLPYLNVQYEWILKSCSARPIFKIYDRKVSRENKIGCREQYFDSSME